jgi:hypothetical protein
MRIKVIRRKGGEGSGNFGHAGRPGQVGGSSSEGNSESGPKINAYHTSLTDFNEFDSSFIGSSTGHTGIAAGFFFSLNKNHSSHKADGEEGWISYEVELAVSNPAKARNYEEAANKWGEGEDAVRALTAAGHDALILSDGEEIVVWDTSKIKIKKKNPQLKA